MKAALLVVDMQRALCEGEEEAYGVAGLIERVNGLLAKARTAGAPVVFVQHEEQGGPLQYGSEAWTLDSRLSVRADDARVRKTRPDAFEATSLREVLGDAQRLVICGQQTDCCIDATVRGAAALGYQVALASDAHSTVDSGGATATQIIAAHNAALATAGAEVRPAAEISLA